MSGLIPVGCYECGETFEVQELQYYSSRQLCNRCLDERGARWAKLVNNADHVHDWRPMSPEDGPYDHCDGCNTARPANNEEK